MTTDTLAALGAVFLGSRLKRLSDRLQSEAGAILQSLDLPIQPAQQLLLAALQREGPLTVGVLAERLRISQPAITRTVQALIEQGLVTVSRAGRDQRHKTLALSEDGEAVLVRAQQTVWPRVEAAVLALCGGEAQAMLDQIARLEAALDAASLTERFAAQPQTLTLREFSDDLAPDFYRINAEWIGAMFALEPMDEALLSNPRERIVDDGGVVLFAQTTDLGVVGTCALMRKSDGWFELTKMGVLETARGRKVGEFLLAQTLARAEAMGIERLYLLTNARCEAAIHLYRKLGFVDDAQIMATFGTNYARCDVAMAWRPRG